MLYHSDQHRPDYFPPILGNGQMSLTPDCEGSVDFLPADFPDLFSVPSGRIFRPGRRLISRRPSEIPINLISFGAIECSWMEKPLSWQQELKEEEGMILSRCQYPGGAEIQSRCFIHPHFPLYAMEKKILQGEGMLSFRYTLKGYDAESQAAIFATHFRRFAGGGQLSFDLRGQDLYQGEAILFLDAPCQITREKDGVLLSCPVRQGDCVHCYLALQDDLDTDDPHKENQKIKALVRRAGFSGLLRETCAAWQAYFAQGYVRTGDETADWIYRVGLYHLKCWTTKWSIPVGLNDASWHGRFFAFDEYYSFLALLGANRLDLARRVPAFRLQGLPIALHRASSRGQNQAHYPWETTEYGLEGAPDGFWKKHVFHMAVIAQGAYEYFEHTQDRDFLAACYPMIRGCAEFYTRHMIYTDESGRIFAGRCTDLERLGSSVENPLFTSCGIIRTLECLAGAAGILNVDADYRRECLRLAAGLRQSLPMEEGRYVPHLGCRQKSIAVFTPKFPFHVIPGREEALLRAWDDYIEQEQQYGNMYAVGGHVSPWYACWKAAGFARAGMGQRAYEALRQSYESIGVFGEMFEINEPEKRYRPWFTTAAGVFLSTVNEMLLQSDGENIEILPAWPEEMQHAAFKLSAKGGAIVEARIENGRLIHLQLSMQPGLPPRKFRICFRGEFLEERLAD